MRSSVKDIVSGGVLFGLAVAMGVGASGIKKTLLIGVGSAFVPLLVAALLAWMGVSVLVQGVRALPGDAGKPRAAGGGGRLAAVTFVLIALYVGLLERVGFMLTTILYLIGQFYVLAPKAERRPVKFVVVAVAVAVATYYIFVSAFDLMLPAGWLG